MLDNIIERIKKQYDDLVYQAFERYCGIKRESLIEYKDRIEIHEYPNGDKVYVLDEVPVFIVRMVEDKGMYRLEAAPMNVF